MPLPHLPPRRQRGQAVAEYVAWVAILAVLVAGLGAALVAAGVPQAVAAAISGALRGDGSDAPAGVAAATERTRALVLAAVHGSPDGNAATVSDAERLLAEEVGADAAHAEVTRLALETYVAAHGDRLAGLRRILAHVGTDEAQRDISAVGPPASLSSYARQERRPEATGTMHVVTPHEARALRQALHGRNTADLHRAEVARLVIETGSVALAPWLRVPMYAAGLAEALGSKQRRSVFPAGLRADDVLLCFPVRRLNVIDPHERRSFVDDAAAFDVGVWHDMTQIVTMRSGSVVAEVISDAPTCP